MEKGIAVVTVLYENYTILDDYFVSLSKQTDQDFHVYLVDLSEQKRNYSFPSFVTYIQKSNKGYAFGLNVGIQKAVQDDFTHFSLMNCDTIVKNGFIRAVKHSLHNNPSSIIGGKIYYFPGFEYHKDKYQKADLGKVIWYAGGMIDWSHIQTFHRGVDEVDKGQYDTVEKTEFVTGCLISYDLSVYKKVGQWNESYFLYYEDADYCVRAKKNSIPLIYDPNIVMWHKSGQSTQGAASSFQQKYLDANRFKFGISYAPLRTKLHLLKNVFFPR